MASSVLEVTGMSCSHCEHSVKTAAGSLAGVKEVKVELKTGQVTVEYDPAQVKLQAIREAIEDQGYDVK
ncbi:MAG TPA: copper chaperone CopZ [Syntrophomonas sp.]|jgi:copper chaperone|nr:copper chaperone CopZ [Syntrophomonas sp.]HRW12605.1 copper chaperone CopZ [Syntrophomonas sp.]